VPAKLKLLLLRAASAISSNSRPSVKQNKLLVSYHITVIVHFQEITNLLHHASRLLPVSDGCARLFIVIGGGGHAPQLLRQKEKGHANAAR